MNSKVGTPRFERARGAMIASAVGDALGWPYERSDRSSRTEDAGIDSAKFGFQSWKRISGGLWKGISEKIEAGSYSDDTQMIIAVARARLVSGSAWPAWLTDVELPFFLLYERGAGATVKHACRVWSRSRSPWEGAGAEKYFASGANGVAMRVLPHVLAHVDDSAFEDLAADVIRDAVLTHGHPRAIIGALAHAYALWVSLNEPAPIGFGWLIEAILNGISAWSRFNPSVVPDAWREAADQYFDEGYVVVWNAVVGETESMFRAAARELSHGAIAGPETLLRNIGATRYTTNGSGTVCAVAASFLAAWSAPQPLSGMKLAAQLNGADTDTLASMLGGLLGAALGTEWLGSLHRGVQDYELLDYLATELVKRGPEFIGSNLTPRKISLRLSRFRRSLPDLVMGDRITLPDGRKGIVEEVAALDGSGKAAIKLSIRTEDRQTLYFLSDPPLGQSFNLPASSVQSQITYVELSVRNIRDIRRIFEEVLAVPPVSFGNIWVRYPGLFLREDGPSIFRSPAFRIRLLSGDLVGVRSRAVARGLEVLEEPAAGRDSFAIKVSPEIVAVVSRVL